jgi:hypothetical protein
MHLPARRRLFLGLLLFSLAISALGAGQTLKQRTDTTPKTAGETGTSEAAAAHVTVDRPLLAKGTNLQVEIIRNYPMRAGEAIEGRLLHPIFVDGVLAVPANTVLRGTVVSLEPDKHSRWQGRLRADFTPFHIANVEFKELLLPGEAVPISTTGATAGETELHFAAPGATPQQSRLSRLWKQLKEKIHDQIAFITAPGLGDRATQALYRQLPLHPERIPVHTAWSFELTEPVPLANYAVIPKQSEPEDSGKQEIWTVHALLTTAVTSARAKPGDLIEAHVVEPVFDREAQLVIPEDSTLVGRVTMAKAARSLGRNGKLRFTFQQIRFPEGGDRPVEGALAGGTAGLDQTLSLDAEGTVSPKSKSSVLAPLLLTMLAGRALDSDGNLTVQTGVASNGFGLVGRVLGLVTGSRNLSAGIGYYAAGLSVYENFLKHGHDVVFPRNTFVEIVTTPLRAPVLSPATH